MVDIHTRPKSICEPDQTSRDFLTPKL